MAKTTGDRQRAFRARRLNASDATGARLSMIVSYNAKMTLARMADHQTLTQTAMLQQLLDEAEKSLLATLRPEEQDAYFDRIVTA